MFDAAAIAFLTILPPVCATFILLFLSMVIAGLLYETYDDYRWIRDCADVSKKQARKAAWANLRHTLSCLLSHTKDSLLSKAYAVGRLVKLLGALIYAVPFALVGLAAFLLGLPMGVLGFVIGFMVDCVKLGYSISNEVIVKAHQDIVGAILPR